jgi:hypothetical protein
MNGLNYAKASGALPPYCLALLQNPDNSLQQGLMTTVNLIGVQNVDDLVKLQLLGLELMNLVGVEALETGVKSLGASIT